jgi:hypothetical protein
MEMSETLAPTVYVSIGLALATTLFGIFVEKYYVSKWTIVFNGLGIASLALALDTSQILDACLLFSYVIVGIVLVLFISKKTFNGKNLIKHLFGSKIYGSIALAYAFNDLNGSFFTKQYLTLLENNGFPKIFDNYLLAFSWMSIITLILLASGIVIVWSHFNKKKY